MGMLASINRAKVNCTTTGTGTLSLGSAVSTYLTPDNAGAINLGRYKILIADGSDWEVSKGTYTTSGATMTRTLIKSSTGSLLNLTGNETVAFIDDADDENGGRALGPAQGVLTNSTGVPIPTSTVSAATSMYFTPYLGNRAPFPDKDGFGLVMREFTELSQALSDTTKSPAAAGALRCYDWWLWDDAGTLRCTRGPGWTDGGRTGTVTIASPGVWTLNSHGFYDGQPVVPTTSGALPTGYTASTIYYVVGGAALTTNTFQLAATAGGAAINTTGSQSGVHTITTYVTSRSTGAGSEEHDTTTYPGYRVNKNAITNGPGAGLGLYVGSAVTNASSQLDIIFGGAGASGGESVIYSIWNMYNRREIPLINYDNADTWTYTNATPRMKNGNYANRISFMVGLVENPIKGYNSVTRSLSNQTNAYFSIGYCSSTVRDEPYCHANTTIGISASNVSGTVAQTRYPTIGLRYIAPQECCFTGGAGTWVGDNGSGGTFNTLNSGSTFTANIWA